MAIAIAEPRTISRTIIAATMPTISLVWLSGWTLSMTVPPNSTWSVGVVEGCAYVVLELLHDRVVDLCGRLVELHVDEPDLAVLADATALAGVRVTDADHAWYLAGRLPGGLDVLARSVAR